MEVTYIVDYPIFGDSGKHKATREKAKALSQNDAVEKFTFLYDKPRTTLLSKILGKILFDIRIASKVFLRKDFIVVQRVFFLPLTRIVLGLKQVKVISEFHADLAEEIPLLNKPEFHKYILRFTIFFFYLNYKLSHGIIFNHPYLKTKFDPKFNKPSIYTYNGANINEYFPIKNMDARDILKISHDKKIFLFLGSVSQWHGVEYLINIFNDPKIALKSELWLYVVGAQDNYYTSELKSTIKNERIIFKPPVDTKTANYYINASDYCLLPVKQIRSSPGSPIKLYDYISCGKPVITQENLAGYSDEVEKYNLGYTIDFTNSESAAGKIVSIVDNYTEESSQEFQHNNRSVAINEVSWESRMDRWCVFLKRLVTGS